MIKLIELIIRIRKWPHNFRQCLILMKTETIQAEDGFVN
jgi:hypothetical protein